MKKNVMMRLACFLLVAVLISTSAISGTYAKYVTEASGSDKARVAKWGVEVTAQGSSMFNNEYTNTTNGLTVKSEEDDVKVVAPGTNSTEAGGAAVFTISGKPEVATVVTVDVKNTEDVFLKAGTYTDYTKHLYNETTKEWYYDTFTLEKDYYPVVWTLELTSDASDPSSVGPIESGTLKEVVDALNTYVSTAKYEPLEDLGATFELSWDWAFDTDNNPNEQPTNDKADTLLGNLAADAATYGADIADGAYNLEVAYEVTITVTQVD